MNSSPASRASKGGASVPSATSALSDDPQPVRDHDQHLVALGMAEAVVDLLEAVEVDEQQSGAAALAGAEDALGLAAEMEPVGKRGDGIVHRHRLGVVEIGADLLEQAFDGGGEGRHLALESGRRGRGEVAAA